MTADVRRRLTELRDRWHKEADEYDQRTAGAIVRHRLADELDALVRQIPESERTYTAQEIADALSSFKPVVGQGDGGHLYVYRGPRPLDGTTPIQPAVRQIPQEPAMKSVTDVLGTMDSEGPLTRVPSANSAGLDGRIVALARMRAFHNHVEGFGEHSQATFASCLHPDCVLVRTLDVKGEPKP